MQEKTAGNTKQQTNKKYRLKHGMKAQRSRNGKAENINNPTKRTSIKTRSTTHHNKTKTHHKTRQDRENKNKHNTNTTKKIKTTGNKRLSCSLLCLVLLLVVRNAVIHRLPPCDSCQTAALFPAARRSFGLFDIIVIRVGPDPWPC